jgi:hypothetical protein
LPFSSADEEASSPDNEKLVSEKEPIGDEAAVV